MFNLVMLLWAWCLAPHPNVRALRSVPAAAVPQSRLAGDRGQTTAEYALMLIAAAALAVVVIGWISKTDAIGKLFDEVLKHVTGKVA